jgi:hypothetical protein
MKLKQRIEKAEEAVGVGQEKAARMIIIMLEFADDGTLPHFEEPYEEWETFKAEEKKCRHEAYRVFEPHPFREYEARHGLKPGTLSEHELRGKVPFAELLAVATSQQGDKA